ncbi:PrsW family intramembrane metalloprotease [Lentzea sp. JNUCC 0626]|uniref:PrsW family intramembrane metalloprotease n=1 Tax=Lentzea sp. JNUCC 0626 TaxID=3367513 RepID=UPI00374A764E
MTTTSFDSDRARTIEASGRSVPFQLAQPRNAAFWVLTLGLAAGAWVTTQIYLRELAAYWVALSTGLAGSALYAALWLAILLRCNKFVQLPRRLLAMVTVWSGLVSTMAMAAPANDALSSLYAKAFGQAWVAEWSSAWAAPFTEEISKATAVVLALGLAPHLVRSARDGLMTGAFAGLGFQFAENVLYAFQAAHHDFGTNQLLYSVSTLTTRAASGLLASSHVVFSALFCAGLLWLLGRPDKEHRLHGATLMASAIALHFLFNGAEPIAHLAGLPAEALRFAFVSPVLYMLLWWALRLSEPEHRVWTRAVLTPEVARGVLTDAEATAASGGWRHRRAYLRTRPRGPARKQGKRVLASTLDLVRELTRSAGSDTEEVRLVRVRTELLRRRAGAG